MSEGVLKAEKLVRVAGRLPVLNGVDLELSPGRVLALMGPNGAGKSTLLYVLAGLWSYSSGQLWRFGELLPTDNRPDPRVALLAHQSFLYSHLTLEENLLLYGRLYGVDRARARARWATERVGLQWAYHERLRTFSRGMRQRAALARVLMQDARLWLLDEPSSGLDREGRAILAALIAEAREDGVAILMTTHVLSEALRSAEALAILKAGRFVWWSANSEEWDAAQARLLGVGDGHA
ncbi:ATP-binding cassette domain-containing protein [Sulfobacillus harzensis]|uniref:ABC transporter ATP-binding protein n=1 Tax=Sulfobacillus harzensis TaxID=2729629 RepID=A0A7Y0L5T0_9FIRM|nr:ABC transporter ATP-binding protein [Sulfobacillus harzensis]NMP23578.1 ABC transporter ATP-binding protein [Sulfobacillus harzensis]